MPFAPTDLIKRRVQKYSNSDSELFTELLYAGELIVKITVAAFVASIEDDREHHRYRLLHALVRADGIGEWSRNLEEALTGPASQHLATALTDDRRIFSERVRKGGWQHEAVQELQEVLMGVYPEAQPLGDRVILRSWFTKFAELRNKTRGHGAITPANCAKLAPKLYRSVDLLIANNPIFHRAWAYLHRNLSGKYKVIELGGDTSVFAALKTASAVRGENYPDGVYISAGRPRRVDLLYTDLDASDFFLPNGGFNGKTYELHSLITDDRLAGDASPYLRVAGSWPVSETEGKGELEVVGNVFTNLPVVPSGYIRRAQLEAEIREALTNDRHPVVTLVGRGGIGKTSLALAVLHEITRTARYDVIVWFSARDIDLTMAGPKAVQPRVLAESDIAEEYRSLVEQPAAVDKKRSATITMMEEHMRCSPLGATLFVFDNFETVRSPVDLFQWIDTNIRLPNKAVITSRFREFKADLPIEISGMEQEEAGALISQTAIALNIVGLIGLDRREQIIEESDGHPYVIKIILGEIANTGRFGRPSTLIVRKEEILDALFDRTYANLSPMASRVFLTLSGWRSLVPQLAVQAVVRRHGAIGGGGDPEHAIDELVRMSLVERIRAGDNTDFLGVPLTAALFGARKLEVSPYRQLIEDDIRFLHDLGATTATGLKEGIRPRMVAFFRKMGRLIGDSSTTFEEMRPVLEFVARSYSPAWLMLSELCSEVEGGAGLERSADYVRHFLEEKPQAEEAEAAWLRLMTIYRSASNIVGCCSAFIRAAEISEPPLYMISNIANLLNNEREVIEKMDVAERAALFKPLARLMEGSVSAASATDLSRLAWLHLHAGDERRALDIAESGLQRDPDNLHCQKLVAKLGRYA